MSISSLEINNLILEYLKENNLLLSYKAIQYELGEKYETTEISKIMNNNKQVPFGMLVNLIQKGILYSQLETLAANTNTTTRNLVIDDKIYSLQQLFEDNQDKLIYASNETGKTGGKKKKNTVKTNGTDAANTSFHDEKTLSYLDIEEEFKNKFDDLFTKFEERQKLKLLQNDDNSVLIEPKAVEDTVDINNEYLVKKTSILKPLVSYSACNFATIKGSSLLAAIKTPSREKGFLSSINLKDLGHFKADEDINNIKMCKTIIKKTKTNAASDGTNVVSSFSDRNNIENNESLSLNLLGNKDLLLFHLQNSTAAANGVSSNESVDEVKEEEIALFNQPVSNFIQVNNAKSLFVSCLEDGDILLYSLPEIKLLTKLSMHKFSIISCKFNESSENLLSMDTEGNTILWDLRNFTVLKIFENYKQQQVSFPAGLDFLFIDNAKFMIPIKEQDVINYVGVFEISTLNSIKSVKFIGKLKSSTSVILSMSIFSRLKLLITASDDNKIRIYKGKNFLLPTVTLDLATEDDSILDVYTNEIEEDIFLISAITIKGNFSNWIMNLKNEDKDGNTAIFSCNMSSELLLGDDEVPVVGSVFHNKNYVILGQINGKISVFDVSALFKKDLLPVIKKEESGSHDSQDDEGKALKKRKIDSVSGSEINLCYLFDDVETEGGKPCHINSMDSFIDEAGDNYLNVAFDSGSSKIFQL